MPNYEGLTVDEAIQKGLGKLKLPKAEVMIDVLEPGKKGFLGIGKKAAVVKIEPIKNQRQSVLVRSDEKVQTDGAAAEKLSDADGIAQLASYLTNITAELGTPAMVRVEQDAHLVTFHLESDKPGMLIGKHGKVLNALQYLAQVFIHRVADSKLSIVVNVGDYRERREATLERLANNTADKVRRTGQAVFLEPMPAFERKKIHAILTANPHVKTHSEGDEPFRYLVVELSKTLS